jgi:hypothetical protein
MDAKLVKKVAKKQITIIDFDGNLYQDSHIVAYPSDNQHPATITISVAQFQSFVENKGLNQWCNDFNDPSQPDGHGQLTGITPWQDYWYQYHHAVICQHLTQFVQKNTIH